MNKVLRTLAIIVFVPVIFGCMSGILLPTKSTPSESDAQPLTPEIQDPTVQAALATVNSLSMSNSQENLEKLTTSTFMAVSTQQAIDTTSALMQNAYSESTATQEAGLKATAQAKDLFDLVQIMHDEGLIGLPEGQYYHLEDFDEQLAQSDSIKYVETGHSGSNFILTADTQMNLISEHNWPSGGCGIQLGKEADLMEINSDGFIYYIVSYITKQSGGTSALPFRRPIKPGGDRSDLYYYSGSWSKEFSKEHEFNFRLVVYDKQATLFIDGQEVLSEENRLYDTGSIDLFVSSTTPLVTTHCKMTNIELWIFDEK